MSHKIYITFGQVHAHRVNNQTFDKDSVAAITCEDHEDGRRIANELFGDKFCFSYDEMPPKKLAYFPRGIIDAN